MESSWVILALLACSLISATYGGVSTPTPDISVKEGANAEFKCDYTSDYQQPRVEWKFVSANQDAIFIYYDGEKTGLYAERAVVYPKGLRLNNVNSNDNGFYVCEVVGKDSSGNALYGEAKTKLTVLVPPSKPITQVPSSPTVGSVAVFNCIEKSSSPPALFTWYKDTVQMPVNPKESPTFQNSSYTIDPTTGVLKFDNIQKGDSGDYFCEARNSQGFQASAVVRVETREVNVGGIVAAVIVSILILLLIAFGLWFAYSRGYFNKKTNKKVIYSQPSETRSDRNFQQTSSFLV